MDKSDNKINFTEFYQMYKKELLTVFKNLENKRNECLKSCKKAITVFIFFIFLSIIFFIISLNNILNNSTNIIYFFTLLLAPTTAIILIMVMPGCIKRYSKKYRNSIKEQSMPKILEIFGNIKWEKYDKNTPSIGILKNYELDKSGLFIHFNEQYIDDEFYGEYKGVSFRISESKLFWNAQKGSYPAFEGVIITFKYNKNINNRTVIATKGTKIKKDNILYSIMISAFSCLQIFKHGYSHGKLVLAIIIFLIFVCIDWKQNKDDEPLDKVSLEDPKFNKRFNVYSSDEVEARYLVTPLFMELLNGLKTAFGNKELKCSFFDDNLMIAISTKEDIFEIGDLYTPYNNPNQLIKFYRELSSIYKMIEYFKLDEKIYLRK